VVRTLQYVTIIMKMSSQRQHQHQHQHQHRRRRQRRHCVNPTTLMRTLLHLLKVGITTALLVKTKAKIPPSLPPCVGRLSIKSVKNYRLVRSPDNNESKTRVINYHVIGTSHFSCNSYNEVSALINLVQPNACVVELDPERTLRLTLDHAMVLAINKKASVNINKKQHQQKEQNRLFGADLLSAIETSKELDIPIFWGDESPIETRTRFFSIFDVQSYNGDKLMSALISLFRRRKNSSNQTEDQPEILFIDVIDTFLNDPRKIIPLVTTLILPLVAVGLSIVVDGLTTSVAAAAATSLVTTEAATTNNGVLFNFNNSEFFYEILATLLSLSISYVASCKVYNNLIVDRDVVLASNAQRAAETIAMLNSKQLIRKRWTFPLCMSATNDGINEELEEEIDQKSDPLTASTTIPLFTLKTPLERNAVRKLNLFEPRWLKMIDQFLLSKPSQQQIQTKNGEVLDKCAYDRIENHTSEQQTIGCVVCENKFYSAVNLAEDAEGNFVEGRYADVIFRRRGRFGELINIIEGNRPSGARKVLAKIVGRESFEFPSSTGNGDDRISVVPEGYLTSSNLQPVNKDQTNFKTDIDDIETEDDEINIVVVVGLLHVNGVLECLSRNYSAL